MIKYDWLIRYYSTPSEKITIAQWDGTDNHGIDLSQFISNDATYSLLKVPATCAILMILL